MYFAVWHDYFLYLLLSIAVILQLNTDCTAARRKQISIICSSISRKSYLNVASKRKNIMAILSPATTSYHILFCVQHRFSSLFGFSLRCSLFPFTRWIELCVAIFTCYGFILKLCWLDIRFDSNRAKFNLLLSIDCVCVFALDALDEKIELETKCKWIVLIVEQCKLHSMWWVNGGAWFEWAFEWFWRCTTVENRELDDEDKDLLTKYPLSLKLKTKTF